MKFTLCPSRRRRAAAASQSAAGSQSANPRIGDERAGWAQTHLADTVLSSPLSGFGGMWSGIAI